MPLYLGALLPLSGSWLAGKTIVGALSLAVEQINADTSLLPGRRLIPFWYDGGCSASAALSGLYNLPPQSAAVIGPACDDASTSTAYLTAGAHAHTCMRARM